MLVVFFDNQVYLVFGSTNGVVYIDIRCLESIDSGTPTRRLERPL